MELEGIHVRHMGIYLPDQIGGRPIGQEGQTTDDVLGHYYLSQEPLGILRFDTDPETNHTDTRVQVELVEDEKGHLKRDVEGLALVHALDEEGCRLGGGLVVSSSQKFNEYALTDALTRQFVGAFKVVHGNGLDGVEDTDGLDAINWNMGPLLPHGALLLHDGGEVDEDKNPLELKTHKFVRWERISELFPPATLATEDVLAGSTRAQRCGWHTTDSSLTPGYSAALPPHKAQLLVSEVSSEAADHKLSAALDFDTDSFWRAGRTGEDETLEMRLHGPLFVKAVRLVFTERGRPERVSIRVTYAHVRLQWTDLAVREDVSDRLGRGDEELQWDLVIDEPELVLRVVIEFEGGTKDDEATELAEVRLFEEWDQRTEGIPDDNDDGDDNPCTPSPCGAASTCTDNAGTHALCTCDDGYFSSTADGLNCLISNVCADEDNARALCGDHSECLSTGAGLHVCECVTGYSSDDGTGTDCTLSDPCLTVDNACGAHGVCESLPPADYRCSCKPGNQLINPEDTKLGCVPVPLCGAVLGDVCGGDRGSCVEPALDKRGDGTSGGGALWRAWGGRCECEPGFVLARCAQHAWQVGGQASASRVGGNETSSTTGTDSDAHIGTYVTASEAEAERDASVFAPRVPALVAVRASSTAANAGVTQHATAFAADGLHHTAWLAGQEGPASLIFDLGAGTVRVSAIRIIRDAARVRTTALYYATPSALVSGAWAGDMALADADAAGFGAVWGTLTSGYEWPSEADSMLAFDEFNGDGYVAARYWRLDVLTTYSGWASVAEVQFRVCSEGCTGIDRCKLSAAEELCPDERSTCTGVGADEYVCACDRGFDATAEGCVNIDECAPEPCLNGGACEDLIEAFNCTCTTGFEGPTCAINIDECAGVQCRNNGTCVDGIGEFSCSCQAGFTGTFCQTELDECEMASRGEPADVVPCQNDSLCIDKVNGFECKCAEGFHGSR